MIGLDGTRTCQEHSQSSGKQFYDEFPPVVYNMVDNPHIQLFASPSSSPITIDSPGTSAVHNDSVQDSNEHITSISIGSINYPVIQLLFQTQNLIGHATRVFLIQLPDGRHGVLKDSWIMRSRHSEAGILCSLRIPFGLQLINSCTLQDTKSFQSAAITTPVLLMSVTRSGV